MGAKVYEGSVREVEDKLGIPNNTFAVMKCQQTDKFNYMSSLDKSLVKAYNTYYKEIRSLIDELVPMYYDLEDRKLLYSFSKLMETEGIYKKPNGFSTAAPKIIFRVSDTLNHRTFIKYKKVLKLYKEQYEKTNI